MSEESQAAVEAAQPINDAAQPIEATAQQVSEPMQQSEQAAQQTKEATWQLGYDHGLVGGYVNCPKEADAFAYIYGYIAGKADRRGASLKARLTPVQEPPSEIAATVAQLQ
jgi:hypothetical protein